MPSALADQDPPKAGRPRWWAAGLSLFLASALAVVAWLVLVDEPYVATRPPSSPTTGKPGPDVAGASGVLHDLQAAVSAGDADAAAALAPADAPTARRLLAAVVRNAGVLRVRDLGLRYVTESGPVSADGSWTATVETTWRFAGFDRGAAVAEVEFGFQAEDEAVRLTAIGGDQGRSPLWLTGPVRVARSPQVLVVAAKSAPLARYVRLARSAVPVVRRVVTDWNPRLVVEVPESAEALDRALGVAPGTYRNIAAVTTSVDGSTDPNAPVHVLVNVAEFGRLRNTGAQVVMSHEVAHVATDAATASMPLWLIEGFADYVALRDVRLPESMVAAQVIRQIRREGLPTALPTAADFDVAGSHLGAVYEGAWLVCVVIAEHAGEDGLVALFEAIQAGSSLDRALRSTLGWTERRLVRAWRARLSDLAA